MLLTVSFMTWFALRRVACSAGKYQVKGLARMNDTDRQLQEIVAVTTEFSLSTPRPTTSPLSNVGKSLLMHLSNLPKLVLCP
jgi:hypothetical protein